MASEIDQLRDQVRTLSTQFGRLRDEQDVRKLHHKYGYYLDKCLYKEVVDLYSDRADAFVEFLGGRYKGKDGIKRLYIGRFSKNFVNGRNGPVHGFLLDHPMLQDIIDITPDGTGAWARIRTLMSAGTHQSIADKFPRGFRQWWEGGVYENEYIKEDGVWKILRLRYFPFWHANFHEGWGNNSGNHVMFPKTFYPEDPVGPDEPVKDPMLWPDTRVVPFHYPHPVTGKHVAEDDLRAPFFGESVDHSTPAISLDVPDWRPT